jgi:hypothetical protein
LLYYLELFFEKQGLSLMHRIIIAAVLLFYSIQIVGLLISNKEFLRQDDPYEQAMVGKSMLQGNGIRFHGKPYVILPPGLSAAVGGVDLLVHNLEWSGKIVSLFSFLSCLFLLRQISSFFFLEKRFIFLPVILFATNSNIMISATNGRSESLFTLTFLGLVYITVISNRKPSAVASIIFAFLWAFFYYIRPEGLVIGGVLFLWLMWEKHSSLSGAGRLLLIPALVLLLIIPYLLFLKQNTGRWQLSGKSYINLVMGELNSPYQKGEPVSERTDPRYLITDRVMDNPRTAKSFTEYWGEPENDIVARIPHNLFNLGKAYWFSFSLVGIILWVWGMTQFNVHENAFLVSVMSTILLYAIFFILLRSVATYHWIVFIYVAAGLQALEHRLKAYRDVKFSLLWIYALTALIVIFQMRSVLKSSYLLLLS